jgi:hypothetical protein
MHREYTLSEQILEESIELQRESPRVQKLGIYVLDSRFVDSSGFAFFVDFFRWRAGFCFASGR